MSGIGMDEIVGRATQVDEQLQVLDRIISEYRELIDELEGRLSEVLRAEPQNVPLAEKIGQELVPLANRISGSCEHLEAINGRVRYIIDRLEL